MFNDSVRNPSPAAKLSRHALCIALALPFALAACGKKEEMPATPSGGMSTPTPAPMSPSPAASDPAMAPGSMGGASAPNSSMPAASSASTP